MEEHEQEGAGPRCRPKQVTTTSTTNMKLDKKLEALTRQLVAAIDLFSAEENATSEQLLEEFRALFKLTRKFLNVEQKFGLFPSVY